MDDTCFKAASETAKAQLLAKPLGGSVLLNDCDITRLIHNHQQNETPIGEISDISLAGRINYFCLFHPSRFILPTPTIPLAIKTLIKTRSLIALQYSLLGIISNKNTAPAFSGIPQTPTSHKLNDFTSDNLLIIIPLPTSNTVAEMCVTLRLEF
ncbi:hypothetical protein EON64_06295 [archaeon]|nr:MAG: hypothetical protein EON64_06295 [archaeon]